MRPSDSMRQMATSWTRRRTTEVLITGESGTQELFAPRCTSAAVARSVWRELRALPETS